MTRVQVSRRRDRRARGVAISALLGFMVVMVLVVMGDTHTVDIEATRTIQRLPTAIVLGLMVAVSWLGFEPQAALIGLSIVAFLCWRGRWLEGGFALLALTVAALNGALKLIFARPRPVGGSEGIVVHGSASGSSFPSGHTITYVVFCGFLVYLTYTRLRPGIPRAAVLVSLIVLIALVGPSRVYLGQHWFTDVLASYLLGSAILVGLIALYQKVAAGRVLARPGEPLSPRREG